MADNEKGQEASPRGNEWEVVSLTASAYAAAPGPKQVVLSVDNQENLSEENKAETSDALFMPSHFVYSPSVHENLSLEAEYVDIDNEKKGKDDVSPLVADGSKLKEKDEADMSIKELMFSDFSENQIFDEKSNSSAVSGADLRKDVAFDKEQNIYSAAEYSSIYSETTLGKSEAVEHDVETDDMVEPVDHGLDAGLSNSQKPSNQDKYDESHLPCEAWWKRQALSLYGHAKEANTFWSICIAAAVMGVVILGQRWQQERWQVLHLRWKFGVNDERMGSLFGPISRFKDVIVGGHQRRSLIRGSSSAEH